MNSDYERFVKLLFSLMDLVIRQLRSTPIVCAAMQKIIFEEKGRYPQYKNWPEIARIGAKNPFAVLAVAMIDTEDCKVNIADVDVQRMIAAFPDCFSFDFVVGPVPFSAILRKLSEAHLACEVAPSFGLPVTMMAFSEEGARHNREYGVILIPDSISPKSEVGDLVTWNSKEFVVVYVDAEELHVVPADCVNLSL